MRRNLATTRITLQEHRLPPSAENTELNYRTCVTSPAQDTATTVRLMSLATLVFVVVALGLRFSSALPYWVSIPADAGLILWAAARGYARFARDQPSGLEFMLAAAVLFVGILFGFVNYAPTTRGAYLLIFGTGLLIAAAFAHFVVVQACAFMAVNERIPRLRMRRWLRRIGFITTGFTPKGCPELNDYRLSFLFLLVAYLAGYVILIQAEKTGNSGYAAIFGVSGFFLSLLAIKLMRPEPAGIIRTPFLDTLRASWRALRVFVCYNRHKVEAAGLFRFPTKALRPPLARDLFLSVTLAFLATALVGVSFSSPIFFIRKYWSPSTPAAAQADPSRPAPLRLSYEEDVFAKGLPEGQREPYFAAKRRDQAAQAAAERLAAVQRHLRDAVAATVSVCTLGLLGPSLVLVGVIWFVGGNLLARFYAALEAPDAYELPPEPDLSKGESGTTVWDNRIERMTESRDKLEAEHFYLGATIEGDYPVLLHQELLYRHAHILGDTGSRKTSIGIAPIVTQLISRRNCSVIIFDLKGDRSLFNAVRDEANSNGLPFKWFTNVVGKSSYVFNPLAQSHLHNLTTDQLTQGLLQALELEHGEGYGRGHFTALNDAVLGTYLRHFRKQINSFEELHRYVSDRNAYRNISSDDEDWRHTRQLVNLVEKIASLVPMNVTAESLAKSGQDRPRVLSEQIDMAAALRTPHVLYFYLSSSLDPRTVSPIAKLAMFSLLAASEFRQGVEPRAFIFIDEFQRVLSESMTIFLEQARSKGLHFILANQSISQLNSRGVDITGVVESCTGFKQSFRASDQENIRRIVENSGEAVYHSVSWTRTVRDAFDENTPSLISLAHALRFDSEDVSVSTREEVGPRLEQNTVIETSALPLGSFVRFDEGSGYTQFSGFWTTILSEYHISKPLYDFYTKEPFPDVGECTVTIPVEAIENVPMRARFFERPIPTPRDVPPEFEDDLSRRLELAARRAEQERARVQNPQARERQGE